MADEKKEFNLDDFLADAAKVVNPIQANTDIEGLMQYTEEEIKLMDAERDRALAIADAEKKEELEAAMKDLEFTVDQKLVDEKKQELIEEIEEVLAGYGTDDELDIIKFRMFCYMADFQRPIIKPLLDRSSKFFTQMEEVTPYQLARDSKIIYLLDDILKTLQRR